jgi:uncharacterized double-CXXCG motif protein
VTCRQSPL